MELEDALSTKFKTLIEGLMMTTTSEIVKVFSKLLLETRVEITRSWREIDLLKQHLEECEQQKTEAIIRAQRSDFKREDEEFEVSHASFQLEAESINMARPEDVEPEDDVAESVSVGNRCVSLDDASANGPETTQSSEPASSGHVVQNVFATATNSQKTKCQKMKCTRIAVKQNLGCPTKVSRVKAKTRARSTSSGKTVPQPTSKRAANGPSTSGHMPTFSPDVMEKRGLIKRRIHANARGLRNRQHLSMQRHCLCCSTDECNLQPSLSRAQVPSVYICRKCEKRFKTDHHFKSHKCAMPKNCKRCGQMFSTLQGLTAHRQEGQTQFSCHQCEQTFTTLCVWTIHKRSHTDVPIEIKGFKGYKRFEVRLERISDALLEAALSSGSHPSQNNSGSGELATQSTTMNDLETSNTQLSKMSDSTVGQSSVRKVYAVMSSSSGQIQTSGDEVEPETLMVHETEQADEKGSCPSPSEESGLCTPQRRRKMADCSHDAYNGVFPVENILRWRNNKGRNEVRVKWMPCTLCGAKFQNTWEPAESFPGYLDGKNEEPKKSLMDMTSKGD